MVVLSEGGVLSREVIHDDTLTGPVEEWWSCQKEVSWVEKSSTDDTLRGPVEEWWSCQKVSWVEKPSTDDTLTGPVEEWWSCQKEVSWVEKSSTDDTMRGPVEEWWSYQKVSWVEKPPIMILLEALYRNGGGFNFLHLRVVLGQTATLCSIIFLHLMDR
jgi:hypothetical protein